MRFSRRKARPDKYTRWGGPASQTQVSTTSFLTATTLIYAIGAGITAAAGLLDRVDSQIYAYQSSRDGRYYWQPSFQMGMARPLSQLRELTDTLACSTQAMLQIAL